MGTGKNFNTKQPAETLAEALTAIFNGEITKKWLAIRLGITDETVRRWANGETVPDIVYFAQCVKVLPKEHAARLMRVVFWGAGFDIQSSDPIPVRFLDVDQDGDVDRDDLARHLMHASLRVVDAQLTDADKNAGRFDTTDKIDAAELHLKAALQISAGA